MEPHWLEVVERRLPVADLPQDLAGSRLVQLSDLHIGPRVDDDYLLRSFQRVKEMAPEFVIYTGDFTSYEAQVFEHAQRMFSHLPLGSRGTFGILGNHDYGLRWSQANVAERIAGLATDVGVRVLRNELVECGGLHIVGLDDIWARRFDLAAGIGALPARAAAIVLSRRLDTSGPASASRDVRLMSAAATAQGRAGHRGGTKSAEIPNPVFSACLRSTLRLNRAAIREPMLTLMAELTLETNCRPASPLDAERDFGRPVCARSCVSGGSRSALRSATIRVLRCVITKSLTPMLRTLAVAATVATRTPTTSDIV